MGPMNQNGVYLQTTLRHGDEARTDEASARLISEAVVNGKVTPGDIFKAVDVDNSDDINMARGRRRVETRLTLCTVWRLKGAGGFKNRLRGAN